MSCPTRVASLDASQFLVMKVHVRHPPGAQRLLETDEMSLATPELEYPSGSLAGNSNSLREQVG